MTTKERPFFVANSKAVIALPFWLAERQYNFVLEAVTKDGRPFIGLSWDKEPRGLIIILDMAFYQDAQAHCRDWTWEARGETRQRAASAMPKVPGFRVPGVDPIDDALMRAEDDGMVAP